MRLFECHIGKVDRYALGLDRQLAVELEEALAHPARDDAANLEPDVIAVAGAVDAATGSAATGVNTSRRAKEDCPHLGATTGSGVT